MKIIVKSIGLAALLSSATVLADGKFVDVPAVQYDGALKVAMRQAQSNDAAKAFPVLLQYARYGEKVAQNLVGTYFISGVGAPQDVAQGIVWMAVSLEQQDKIWKKNYDQIIAQLSKEQMAQLQILIDQHKAKYGVDAQHMTCRSEPRKTGSSLRIHLCQKIRDKDDDVQIQTFSEDAPIAGAELAVFK